MDALDPVRSGRASLFDTVLIPVANLADAEATCSATAPYLVDQDAGAVVVHVIEKRRLAPDKAPLAERRSDAKSILDRATEHYETAGISVDTHVVYGTSVAETILDATEAFDASVIAFTPRRRSRWRKLLSEDVAAELVSRSPTPVLVIPADTSPTGLIRRVL